jgi:hypothetical protein
MASRVEMAAVDSFEARELNGTSRVRSTARAL